MSQPVPHGALELMVLRTLQTMGPLHGFGIARRIEQISGAALELNQGTIYPLLIRLVQEGKIKAAWGVSDNKRRARFYSLTRLGEKHLTAETREWERVASLLARFLPEAK